METFTRVALRFCLAISMPALLCLEARAVTVSEGPSFRCEEAETAAEKMICEDSQLSALDLRLDEVYGEALDRAADEEALRESQREWLSEERDLCSEVECMRSAYSGRISALEADGVDRAESGATADSSVTEGESR